MPSSGVFAGAFPGGTARVLELLDLVKAYLKQTWDDIPGVMSGLHLMSTVQRSIKASKPFGNVRLDPVTFCRSVVAAPEVLRIPVLRDKCEASLMSWQAARDSILKKK